MWRAILVCPLAAGMLISLPARAEHTRFWRQSDYSQFEKGTAQGVALRSDGKLMPAPRFSQFSDPNLAYLWALRADSKGRIYAAGGSNAKVVRLDDSGKAATVFESQELTAQALAIDAHDNLYVGTSPDGKVYKVTPDGKHSAFFEPKTKYIWALAFDTDGTLFVATGDEGEVFAVTTDGKGQVFYKSDERHARSLAFDAKGNLVIGTDPDGLIVRVEKVRKSGKSAPEAGAGFVLYETSKKEVTALAADAKGNLYAAAIGEKAKGVPFGPTPTAPVTPQPAITITILGQQPTVAPQAPVVPQPTTFQPFPSLTGGSEVYRIAPDGSPKSLWSSREESVYALGLSPAGKLLLGTGNRGSIIQLEGDDIFSSLAKTASAQVTNFTAAPDGTTYLATANPGKVFMLGPGYAKEGTFESEAFDAKIFSQWGRLTWWGENGAADGKVSFYVRSGNTSAPEKDWSSWAGPYTSTAAEIVKCPPARFVQWKAVFRSATGDMPNISWVSLAYLPKNVAPVIDAIALEDPGVRAQGFPTVPQQGPGNLTPVPLRLPQTSAGTAAAAAAAAAAAQEFQQKPKGQFPTQGFAQKGYQSVVWTAHDDNDDDLLFSIYYRGEGEKNWRLLKDRIEQRFYSWDTTAMPDGAYTLKIIASDGPSNPPDEALATERESDRFEVDNTPPVIENMRAETSGNEAQVRFDGRDSASNIARAEYSLDAGDWQIVFPIGRVSDAHQESYRIALAKLSPGEHTLAVQVYDRFENSTTAKATFTIAARAKR